MLSRIMGLSFAVLICLYPQSDLAPGDGRRRRAQDRTLADSPARMSSTELFYWSSTVTNDWGSDAWWTAELLNDDAGAYGHMGA